MKILGGNLKGRNFNNNMSLIQIREGYIISGLY